MPIKIDISMLGDKELSKAFKKLPEKMQKKALLDATKDVAGIVAMSAKLKIPSQPEGPKQKRRPGSMHLKDTLKVVKIKGKQGRYQIGWNVVTGTREELGIDPKAKYYYPAAVELGSKNRPPHSFLRSTIAEKTEGGIKYIASKLRKFIERQEAKKV